MATHVTEIHLTPADLAERWGCTVGHLANLRSEGKSALPYLKLGHHCRYRLADVLAVEAASVVTAVA
jgi:hypothetical protein